MCRAARRSRSSVRAIRQEPLCGCVNHLETVQAGEIAVGDVVIRPDGLSRSGRRLTERQIARFRTDIGMVFQSFNLFHHLNVLKNLIEARSGARLEPPTRRSIARAISCGASACRRRKSPTRTVCRAEQQQRIAIARALMNGAVDHVV